MTIPLPTVQVWDATGATALGPVDGYTALVISDVFSDAGAISITIPRNIGGAELLDTDDDRQLLLRLPGVDPLWFIADDDAGTWISDDASSEPLTFTGRSLHGLFAEAVVIPSGGIGTTPAEWAFTGATPGKVVTDLVASAQGRGLLQNVTVAGSATLDATGTTWPDTVDVTYKSGQTLLEVLTGLRDAQLLEHRWAGRTLELHRAGGGLDRDSDVVLRPKRDVVAAPLTRSRRSVATAAIVEGSDGDTARSTQTLAGRRAREAYVSETSAPFSSLAAIGDLYLAAHATADVQFSHELTDAGDSPLPWVDYRPGDRVLTLAAGSSLVRRRVMQMTVTFADAGASVSLELGSILKTQEEIMAAKLARLLPGQAAIT